ncbi:MULTISPECIES: hypothetical protein [unclassified Mesorhizobium]|uniref:hypothetical protein n=1 Tax=unclassified Mesorhizobium TaxID=325217 RepID=UPI0003D06B97|nr:MULTISPECIES: hypothetical protein [unclassified Mesorhizobium]ESZ07184.1 hypothetical protein X736_11080 [Mesorhizobium sp. L2C089B000]WJI52582.1 hypothetical protein NLY44_07910 [Mesorhizobium sp. C089B]
MTDNMEKLADSVGLRLIARLSMIGATPVLGMLGYLAMGWLDAKFIEQAKATAVVASQVQDVSEQLPQLKDRVLTLETNSTRGRAERERFQDDALEQLRLMQSDIRALIAGQAAMTATMEAERRQKR